MFSACDTQTFRGIDGTQGTPAIPFTQISSAEKSEGKTKNLILENFQVSNELLFQDCFSGGIVMPGVFSWQPRRLYLGAIPQLRRLYDLQGRTLKSFNKVLRFSSCVVSLILGLFLS